MTHTNIVHRVACFVAKNGAALEILAMSAALAGIVVTEDVRYEAHFLQHATKTRVEQQAAPVATSLHVRERAPSAAAERAAQRRAERLISRMTIVAEASHQPFPLVQETLRAAAPLQPDDTTSFPAFGTTTHPVSRVPDWGAMTEPAQWNRAYREMNPDDFVVVPSYNLHLLTIPLRSLLDDRHEAGVIRSLTAKLYYSTRFFGAYDLDADEFSGIHPGLDLKLAEDTPVGAVAGGRVHDVRSNERTLGLHVIVEHRAPGGETYYSIYGHLGSAHVRKGDAVEAGKILGLVGVTGYTTGPHLHLQIDRGEPDETYHDVYWPSVLPSREEANLHTVNPLTFIERYAQ